jgi:hypothetical protein
LTNADRMALRCPSSIGATLTGEPMAHRYTGKQLEHDLAQIREMVQAIQHHMPKVDIGQIALAAVMAESPEEAARMCVDWHIRRFAHHYSSKPAAEAGSKIALMVKGTGAT